MAKEIQLYYPTTGLSTIYSVVINSTGSIWNTSSVAFEAPLAANWANYAVSMACIGVTTIYEADFPVGIATPGSYSLLAFIRAGGSPALTDTQIGSQAHYEWTGTATALPVATDSSGRANVGKWLDQAVSVDASHFPNVNVNDWGGTGVTSTLPPSAGVIATTIWEDLLSGSDFSTSGSIGLLLKTGVTVATNNDKTGYSLSVSPPTSTQISTAVWTDLLASPDFSTALSVGAQIKANVVASVTGGVTVSTNNDKAGYSLAVAPPTASVIANTVWEDLLAGGDFGTAGSIGNLLSTNVNATIASRSVYAGGAVASVTGNVGGNVVGSVGSVINGVIITTNNDKTGYSLSTAPPTAIQIAAAIWTDTASGDFTTTGSPGKILVNQLGATFTTSSSSIFSAPSLANAPTGAGNALPSNGLDNIMIEAGMNARQALCIITAACDGILSGAGTGSIQIKGGNNSPTTRINANCDNLGNRTLVTTTLP